MNRRRFLLAAALSAAALRLEPAHAASPATLILFDARYGDARQFATAGARDGSHILPLERDVVRQWFAGLATRMSAPGIRVAGLATHADGELLQGCAAELGLRLRREVFHDRHGAAGLMHRSDRGATAAELQSLGHAGAQWPTQLARLATNPGIDCSPTCCVSSGRAEDHPGTLVSWLVA